MPAHGKQGYAIQGVEGGAAGGKAEVPVATLLASADAAKGEAIFAKCKACHTIDAGGWLADIPDVGCNGNNKGDQIVALVLWG